MSPRHFLYSVEAFCVVAIDGVQNPGNVGTTVRAADRFGTTAVLLGTGCVDGDDPKTVCATMGSMFHASLYIKTRSDALVLLRQWGVRVVGTSSHAPQMCASRDGTQSTYFFLGKEGAGICAHVFVCLGAVVHIPMQGRTPSLHIAMATTVSLY